MKRATLIAILALIPFAVFGQTFTLDTLLPAHSDTDLIIKHTGYTLKYSEQNEQAAWVAYYLTKERVNGTEKRTDNFRPDPGSFDRLSRTHRLPRLRIRPGAPRTCS